LKSLKTVQAGACRQAIAIALAVYAVGLVGAPATAAEGSSIGHGEGGYVPDFVSIIEEFHRLEKEINDWLAAKDRSIQPVNSQTATCAIAEGGDDKPSQVVIVGIFIHPSGNRVMNEAW
jgi:hypothetical protein